MNELDMTYDQEHELDPGLHPYQLDERLAQDTIYLGHFKLCDLLLMNDANYPWLILVPRRSEVTELFQLSQADQSQLMRESCFLAENLKDIFDADKMNVAALGNVVPQLHVHHVVRYESDVAWPAPVWGKVPAKPYSQADIDGVANRVCAMLEDNFHSDIGFTPAE